MNSTTKAGKHYKISIGANAAQNTALAFPLVALGVTGRNTDGEHSEVETASPFQAAALHTVAIIGGKSEVPGDFQVASSPEPGVFIGRCSESATVRIDDMQPVAIEAGRAFLGVVAREAELHYAAGEVTLVLLPRQVLKLADALKAAPFGVSAGPDPALDILMSHAAGLLGRRLPPALALFCESALLGLLAFAAGPGGSAAARGPDGRDALYQEILLDIAANCSRHDFGVSQVAQRHKINVRTLQKMFQQHGVTLKEHLTWSRLQLARNALADPANANKKVSDIAFEAGFNDIATFNRLFRRSFGRTPSSLRHGDGAV
ncbi:helix-turn-helix transcriptional regulator [Xanthobacter oligotrophicus]|uniref:helix-turn-helix transcriptional regulator n=1 Tax=Xanthobacter oligotrophicus TaxID=2607286 RepID=UPI0011F14748|nr:helix-turn-helix transcriptional regulator [Xanthobacter oligotrophicus]MCG5236748.1 helix-turn-helix transcriptional regulator [Xanthobacter oligotrophicus]